MRVSDDEINSYVDGELDVEAELRVAREIAACPRLRARVSAFRRLNAELKTLTFGSKEAELPHKVQNLLKSWLK